MTEFPDVDGMLAEAGFDAEASVLTRRQAEVLALREEGLSQAEIAEHLGTSRANVSSIESSARTNVERARETVSFAEALAAPVTVTIPAGTDIFDAPGLVYEACDDAGIKVESTAPGLVKLVRDTAKDSLTGDSLTEPHTVSVAVDGSIRVRPSTEDGGSTAFTDTERSF